MPAAEFLRGTTSLIVGIAAFLAAIASLLKAFKDLRPSNRGETSSPSEERAASTAMILLRNLFFNIGVTLVLLSAILLGTRFILPSEPEVAIRNPSPGQSVDAWIAPTGSGAFTVTGASSAISSNQDLRIYVLVHPALPSAAGWWIQKPALVNTTGSWSAESWIGSSEFPPQVGQEVDVVAVAAEPDIVAGQTHVDDPKDLRPAAQSEIVHFKIGNLRKVP